MKKLLTRGVLLVLLCAALALPALADSVTDSISVCIGYFGWAEDEFVEKAKFTWQELDDWYGGALDTHEEFYSYSNGSGRTYLVYARGFYIRDLLDYAGVDVNSIASIDFFTKDHSNGAYRSFTKYALLDQPRYYFPNLAADPETGELYAWDGGDDLWVGAYQVEPMLALEDYTEWDTSGFDFESYVDESLFSTGNRFHLFFGQASPEEAATSSAAKYVYKILVTFSGTPVLSSEEDNLDLIVDSDHALHVTADAEDDALTDYVQAGGDLFITVSYTDPDELPNFYALYRLYGFEPIPGLVLEDEARTDAYYESIPNLIPTMLTTDATGTLVAAGYDTLILAGARALETPTQQDSALSVYVALESTEGAYIRTLGAGSTVSIERQADDRTGPFALALCASRVFDGGQNSRAFIIGNDSMFLDNWMYAYTYSGELLLQVSQYLQGKPPVDLDILSRPAVRQQLNVSNVAAPVVLLTLLPMLVAVLAVAVLLPRRHL